MHKITELGDQTAATCILQSFYSLVFGGVGREEEQPNRVGEEEYGARCANHNNRDSMDSSEQKGSPVSHPVRNKDLSILFQRRINTVGIGEKRKLYQHLCFPISDLWHCCLLINILIPWELMGKFMPAWRQGGFHSSHLLLHVHSPSWHSNRGRAVPTSLAITTSPPEAWDRDSRVWMGNTDPEENQNCRCSLL